MRKMILVLMLFALPITADAGVFRQGFKVVKFTAKAGYHTAKFAGKTGVAVGKVAGKAIY